MKKLLLLPIIIGTTNEAMNQNQVFISDTCQTLTTYERFNQLFLNFIKEKKYSFIQKEELKIVNSINYGKEDSKPRLKAFYETNNQSGEFLCKLFETFDPSTQYIFGNLLKTLAMNIKNTNPIIDANESLIFTEDDKINLIHLSLSAIMIGEKNRGVAYEKDAGFVTSTRSQVENALLLMTIDPIKGKNLFQTIAKKFLTIKKIADTNKNINQQQKCKEYQIVFTEIEKVAALYNINII